MGHLLGVVPETKARPMSLNVHQIVLGDRSPVTFGCEYVLTSWARPILDMTITLVSAEQGTYTTSNDTGDKSSGFFVAEGGVFSIDGCPAQRYWAHVTSKDGYSNGETLISMPSIKVIVGDGFHLKIMKPESVMQGVAPYFPTDIQKDEHFDSYHCTEAQAGMGRGLIEAANQKRVAQIRALVQVWDTDGDGFMMTGEEMIHMIGSEEFYNDRTNYSETLQQMAGHNTNGMHVMTSTKHRKVSVEEFMDFKKDHLGGMSEAYFQKEVTQMRAEIVAAGLELPAVEEETQPHSGSLEQALEQDISRVKSQWI